MIHRTEFLTQLRIAKDGNAMLRVLSQFDNTQAPEGLQRPLPSPGKIFVGYGQDLTEVVF